MIEEKQYDIYIIDIKLPKLDGRELYKWLEDKHPQVIDGVIFTTGDVMKGDTQGFIERTGRLYLPKPFTPEELKAIVRQIVNEAEQ